MVRPVREVEAIAWQAQGTDRHQASVAQLLRHESLDEPEIYAAAGLPRSMDKPSPDPVPA